MRKSLVFRFARSTAASIPPPGDGPDVCEIQTVPRRQQFTYEDDAVTHLDESARLVRESGGDTAVVATSKP